MHEAMAKERPFCAPEPMTGEEPLFLLYTSGSTGKPKGMMHTTAGYLLWAAFTHHYTFDYHVGEIYACVADIGWITGHSYIVYGPLANGATTVMFESLPTYPDAGRYWDLVQRHQINQFYTAPTAIRALMKFGADPIKKCAPTLSSNPLSPNPHRFTPPTSFHLLPPPPIPTVPSSSFTPPPLPPIHTAHSHPPQVRPLVAACARHRGRAH